MSAERGKRERIEKEMGRKKVSKNFYRRREDTGGGGRRLKNSMISTLLQVLEKRMEWEESEKRLADG